MAPATDTLVSLIDRARDPSVPVADRHEAFGQIVSRFQDLAFAYACARLRDPALAEDAAQDAFLEAWHHLAALRDPEAFPGWLRRLVSTQCHRRLRSTRLLVPFDDAAGLIQAASDAATSAANADDRALVQVALGQLSPADRLVLMLFYGSERRHAEIAGWLRVPVTTVARRLAHAKRRLRARTLDLMSAELCTQRALTAEAFGLELSVRLRPARAEDAPSLTNLARRLDVEGARRTPAAAPICAYLVEDPATHAPIAYAAAAATIFKPIYALQLAIGTTAIRRHAGDVLLMQVMEDLVARDAIALQHRTSPRHRALVELLGARGFEIVSRAQDWRLDSGGAARHQGMVSTGFDGAFTELEALDKSPALFDSALELVTEALLDDPSERPYLPIHPDTLRRTLRAQRHGVVAVADRAVQGLVAASSDEAVPNACRIHIVVVRKRYRRQGLASAMLAALLAADPHAQVRLVAREDPALTAWLGRCGFVRSADTLLFERLLRPTVHVPRERLDEYVGHYVVEGRQMPAIVIERHGDSLVSKAGDIRDVLLASSASEFFVRHHDGRARFERDASGRVTHLVGTEGPHRFVAIRDAGWEPGRTR